jgi:Squalene-hopene cyclase C-terminal domain/Prenyltransferase and squalene oxidase repeat
MSWEAASFLILGLVLAAGFAWYERSRPSSQVVALVAALAALAVAGRLAFAAVPNVVATTDVVIFAGYALGPAPGFAVGALAGLVSNFWLGQGPWTPWEMVGWGMCGILGAALALSGLRPRRGTLAVVCGLAAIPYGALMNFSLMATYGGDLSLGRFLLLESRAVPFEIAHAAGNVALALAAGPAMVRMLVRFRERFEWRATSVAASLLLAFSLATALPATARAADTGRAVSWLASVQNTDGGWGSSPDSVSSVSTTEWVMLGLEAAGRNPLDLVRNGHSPLDYLRSNVAALRSSGDNARTILALDGSGVNPRSFGGRNLVAALLNSRRQDGSFEGWPATTAYAVIALRSAGATGGLEQSIAWLVSAQNRDGGWGNLPGSESTADITGAVMEAVPGTKAAREGLEWLGRHQHASGGFGPGASAEVNSQSTAWAVQGMVAVGSDPETIRSGGNSAIEYLSARQAADGHFAYSASSDRTPVWVTGQALAAAAEKAFPVPAPPRRPAPAPTISHSGETGPGPPIIPGEGAPSGEGLESLPGGTMGSGSGGATTAPSGSLPVIPGQAPGAPGSIAAPPTIEAAPAAPPPGKPFTATGQQPPKPWTPLGVGLGAGGIALGGVIFLGRRFGW